MSETDEIKAAILEMRDLLRLLAEPAIAERDRKLRTEILRIAGQSKKTQESIMLMDGYRTQSEINQLTKLNKGQMSTLVKKLGDASLLTEKSKTPKLKVFLPPNFFDEKK